MAPQKVCNVAAGLALAALFLAGFANVRGEPDPKTPPGKDGAKQADPFQALKEAFAKGVTTKAVEPKDLPKEIADAAAKNAPGAAIQKAQRQEIRLTMKYVALDKPQIKTYQA